MGDANMKKDKIIRVKPNIDYTKYGFKKWYRENDIIKFYTNTEDLYGLFELKIMSDYTLRIIHFNYNALEILLKLGKDNLIEVCSK